MTAPLATTLLDVTDVDETLVFNYTIASGTKVIGLQQSISSAGDFHLCAIQATSSLFIRPDSTRLNSSCSFRFSDETGYKFSSDFIDGNFLTPAYGNSYPYVINPIHVIKAGKYISIDIQENTASGDSSIVQIAFRGRYRYRMSDVQAQARLLSGRKR